MKFSSFALLLSFFVIGFASGDLCPGERPVITFVNDGICNCDVTISEDDTRHVLGGQSIEVTLFAGSYNLSANATLATPKRPANSFRANRRDLNPG